MMILSLLLLTAMSHGVPVPSLPEEHAAVGPHQYGAQVMEEVHGLGLVRLNGTTVTDMVQVTGSLIASHATIHRLQVAGEANLTSSLVEKGGTITGPVRAQRTTVRGTLSITAHKAIFMASDLEGLTMHCDRSCRGNQVVELRQKTVVRGPILFDSGKGEVHLYSGSEVLGEVKGGRIVYRT